MRHSLRNDRVFFDNLTLAENKQKSKRRTGRKKTSPYNLAPTFFSRRTRLSKSGLQNIVNLHHSQGDIRISKGRGALS